MGFGLSSLKSFLKADLGKISAKTGVLGIDIGSSAIKIVQLRDERGIPTLETYGELQLGPYEGSDLGRSTHLTPTKSIEALVDILRESGATGTQAAFAFAYNASFITIASVPTVDSERIGSMVAIEAKKYIPISLTKVSIDWFPLTLHEQEGRTDVLISAIYNETLERYRSIMKGSGLTPVASEIEIFSSIRSVLSPKDEVVAILDCGASSTRMYIVRNGIVSKTHSVPLSGVELTEQLAKSQNIEYSHAEELKRSVGIHGTEETTVQKTLLSGLERGLREIHTVIRRFEETEGVKVDKVILSGSGALLKGFRSYVEDMFSRPALLADPFSKVAYPAFLEDTLKVAGPSFAVAVGIALRAYKKT
jgi:type IV pilus assembly protein PilM